MITLQTEPRDPKGKLTNAREGGIIPAVIYGNKTESVSVFVDAANFQKVLKEAGESSVVTLLVGDKKVSVLIHEIAKNPVTRVTTHVDFMVVDITHAIHASVSLVFVGESEAAKALNATVTKVLHEIQVEGMSDVIPHSLSVDISTLISLDSHITVGDIVLPKGVALYHMNAADAVAQLSAQKVEGAEKSDTAEEVTTEAKK